MIDPRDKKIKQIGLTTNSDTELERLANRVDIFNRRNNDPTLVELEYMESPAQERDITPKWRLIFTFKNRDIQRAFWLDLTE